ncbi:heavy metal translocating P-type ATPase [Vulcanisaeta thermophila]|uniref:heavy metal translocating P-type ATPase n=1 Tax=Vulcanisaeta thermophila TaxID=867917 RepID=UPI000853A90D|nr:heavy metal translocating P-type ATPase [Vulcanisaeta thermophila]
MGSSEDELANLRIGLRFQGNTREVPFKIIGMHCATCSITVQKALLSVDGVLAATVSLASDEARVIVDPSRFDYSRALKAVQRAGYDIYRERVILVLRVLEPDDVKAVMDALKLPGVFSAIPNPVNHTVTVEYNPLEVGVGDLRGAIERAGFKVVEVVGGQEDFDVDRRAVEADARDLMRRFLVALPLTASIFLLEALMGMGIVSGWLYAWLSLALATPVQFYSGLRFIRGAVRAFRNGTANMDTLVTLGTLSAYTFSLLVLAGLLSGGVFFDASAAVITFVLMGKYLEARARLNVGSAVRELMKLQPRVARVISDGVETEVDASELKPGDLVIVREGDTVPADGIVSTGDAHVNESAMTGESRPVRKSVGDVVLAGTQVVRGYLVLSVTRNGRHTLLAQLIRTVRQAQGLRLPIQTLVDRVAAVFTWVVIAIAITTFLTWYLVGAPLYTAVLHMASVLVVACPCALGLATPVSVVAGVGRAAQRGLLIRNPEAVERMVKVRVMAFDKTGTLTEGSYEVISVIGSEDTLAMAAIAEQGSSHPIARAVLNHVARLGLNVPRPESMETLPGMGVVAQWGGHTIGVGNERLVNGFGAEIPSEIRRKVEEFSGYSTVYVVRDDAVVGAIVVGDRIRDEAATVVNKLREAGINVALLTGDNKEAAMAIANKLGIPSSNVYAELTPDDKVKIISELRGSGLVAMVGDGINDAAALSMADVGIAMGGGTDVAKSAGDVILMRNDLNSILDLIRISRKIMNNVKLNLAYVFTYNSVLIPIAAGAVPGLTLQPQWAGLLMALSSITVTLNALRLRKA